MKRLILYSTTKKIQGLDPGLEKSIARVESRGKTHLWKAFSKNLEIFRKLSFTNSTSGRAATKTGPQPQSEHIVFKIVAPMWIPNQVSL